MAAYRWLGLLGVQSDPVKVGKAILAGGLSAANIAAARATGADVLDVNSSLETTPGVKSAELLAELLVAARSAGPHPNG